MIATSWADVVGLLIIAACGLMFLYGDEILILIALFIERRWPPKDDRR